MRLPRAGARLHINRAIPTHTWSVGEEQCAVAPPCCACTNHASHPRSHRAHLPMRALRSASEARGGPFGIVAYSVLCSGLGGCFRGLLSSYGLRARACRVYNVCVGGGVGG